nr:hypothetical protein [Tanacetum cinerariifolium]
TGEGVSRMGDVCIECGATTVDGTIVVDGAMAVDGAMVTTMGVEGKTRVDGDDDDNSGDDKCTATLLLHQVKAASHRSCDGEDDVKSSAGDTIKIRVDVVTDPKVPDDIPVPTIAKRLSKHED